MGVSNATGSRGYNLHMRRGAIKTEIIDGKSFDIRKEGATVALEAQSIFYDLILRGKCPLDQDLSQSQVELHMMRGMCKENVARVKQLFLDCVVSPKIDNDSFEDMTPNTVTGLFWAIYNLQTAEADKKKEQHSESTE